MNAVVTGAGGHIGFHVAKELLKRGFTTHILIKSENANTDILCSAGAVKHIADLHTSKNLPDIFRNKDVLFHLAAQNTIDGTNRENTLKNTAELTVKVIRAAIEAKVKTIVYTSSVVVFGRSPVGNPIPCDHELTSHPESPYVEGKLEAEKFCRVVANQTGSDLRIVYPSWVLGPDDLKGTPPHQLIKGFLAGNQRYYFGGGICVAHVEDVAHGHVEAWLNGSYQGRYILGGHNITFKELYDALSNAARKKPHHFRIPKTTMVLGSYILNKLPGNKEIPSPGYVKAVVNQYSWYDSTESAKSIGYQIRPLSVIISDGVNQACKLFHRTHTLTDRRVKAETIVYDENDVLLITGFPGWLSTRMVEIMINGDTFGKNKIDRKIRLLSHTKIKCNYELPANFEVFEGDLCDRDSLSKALEGVKCVYHLAAVIHAKSKNEYYKINFQGTKNLIDLCIQKNIRRIVLASTDSICGYSVNTTGFSDTQSPRPYKHYGKSKQLAEEYLFEKSRMGLIDGTSLRAFWFFGPNPPERVIRFLNIFKWNRQPVFGDGKNHRSITHIDDLTRAFISCEKNEASFGKWYWITDGNVNLTVDDIYHYIAESLGVKYRPFYIPKFLCRIISAVDSIFTGLGITTAYLNSVGKFHHHISASSEKAKADFGFTPLSGLSQFRDEVR